MRISTTARVAVATGVVLASTSCGLFGSDEGDSVQGRSGISVITCVDGQGNRPGSRQVDLFSQSGDHLDTFFFPLAENQETLANCDGQTPITALRYYFSGDFTQMSVRQKNATGRWSTGVIKATEPGEKPEFIDLSGGDLSGSQSAGVFSNDGKKLFFYRADFEPATTAELNGEFPEPTIPATVMSVGTDAIGSKDVKPAKEPDTIIVQDTDSNEQPIQLPATINSLIYQLPNSNLLEGTSDPDKVYLPASGYDAKKYPSFGFWAKDDDAVIRGDVRHVGDNAETIPLAKQGDGYDSIDPVVPFTQDRFLGYGLQGTLYDVLVKSGAPMKLNKLNLGLGSKTNITEPISGADKQTFVFVAQQENGKRGLYSATIGDFGTQPKFQLIAKLPAMKKDASNSVAVMAAN